MRSYRDYLDERKVPRGPWCVLELHNVKTENPTKSTAKKAVDNIV